MKGITVRTPDAPWEPAGDIYGPGSEANGRDLVNIKILSDRRSEGGGIAYLARFDPPPGKLIKIVAVARSDEHVYVLEGGSCTRSGEELNGPGDYALNPKGRPHGAYVGRRTVNLLVYSGEPDEVTELSVVDRVTPDQRN